MNKTIFEEMRRMQNEMERIMGALWDTDDQDIPLLGSYSTNNNREIVGTRIQSPRTDVWETDKEVHIRIDVPGVQKEDITITPVEGGLEIAAEKKDDYEEKDEKKGYYRIERSRASYKRLVPLPRNTGMEKAKAKYDNGVLKITMPKTKEIQNDRRILIE
ncbi:MAG: Hsp20/alpha crystallin family protein [Candidatus Woesearchaeota archaeon]